MMCLMVGSSMSAAALRAFQTVVAAVSKPNISSKTRAMSASTFFIPESWTMNPSAFLPKDVPRMPGRFGLVTRPQSRHLIGRPMWAIVRIQIRSSLKSWVSLSRILPILTCLPPQPAQPERPYQTLQYGLLERSCPPCPSGGRSSSGPSSPCRIP